MKRLLGLRSLRNRFVVLIVLITSVVLGLFGLTSYLDNGKRLEEQLDRQIDALAARLTVSLPPVVWRFDHLQVEKTVVSELGARPVRAGRPRDADLARDARRQDSNRGH
jgi:two-component system sensor histidine kinase/response regulator